MPVRLPCSSDAVCLVFGALQKVEIVNELCVHDRFTPKTPIKFPNCGEVRVHWLTVCSIGWEHIQLAKSGKVETSIDLSNACDLINFSQNFTIPSESAPGQIQGTLSKIQSNYGRRALNQWTFRIFGQTAKGVPCARWTWSSVSPNSRIIPKIWSAVVTTSHQYCMKPDTKAYLRRQL